MNKLLARGNKTKEKILKAGIKAWIKDPSLVTPYRLGHIMKMSHTLILYHFPKGLKEAVAQHALDTDDLKLISILIASNHKSVSKLPEDVKQGYIQRIWGGF